MMRSVASTVVIIATLAMSAAAAGASSNQARGLDLVARSDAMDTTVMNAVRALPAIAPLSQLTERDAGSVADRVVRVHRRNVASASSNLVARGDEKAAITKVSEDKVVTPSNIAPDTFKVEEGCTSYVVPVAGDTCYGVIEGTDLNLDQFYCLNPDIDDICSNLYIGVAYCTGYAGKWPSA